MNQRPLELGCDIVMHSTTKYFGGHSDVLGGLNVVRDAELGERLAGVTAVTGGVAGPFDAYLTLRGIKTHGAAHGATSGECAGDCALAGRSGTRAARDLSGVAIASASMRWRRQQMQSGYGAIVAFELDGRQADVAAFMNKLQFFAIAEGLGGVESLVGHPRTMSHSRVPDERKDAHGPGRKPGAFVGGYRARR